MNKETKKQEWKIPASGNLGLLANGYKGLLAWRKVRDEKEKNQQMDTGSMG